MSNEILRIEELYKSFRSHWTFRQIEAVKGISLSVQTGDSFGFLGHNGAGKTTTIKCIVGLISISSGRIIIDGKELPNKDAHSFIGYLPEQPYFYDHLSVYETLDFFASLHNMKGQGKILRIKEVMELVGIASRQKSSVRSLSKGLQQRLGLAQAIINRPKLLLLDEPFSGLDPIGRAEVRRLILDLNKHGTTIVISSHILSDVEEICNRVSIMARGKIKDVFALAESKQRYGERFELRLSQGEDDGAILENLVELATQHEIHETINQQSHLLTFKTYAEAMQAMETARAAKMQIENFRCCGPRLEEIFISLTGNETATDKTPYSKLVN